MIPLRISVKNNFRTKLSNNRGFTLIEMLIGIVIMGIAISMVNLSISQSVQNQERMNRLLDIYQAGLMSKSRVIEELEKGQTSGNFLSGHVEVSWQAELLETKDEAPVFVAEQGRYTNPNFVIRFYSVKILVVNQNSRRELEFKHMIEQSKRRVR